MTIGLVRGWAIARLGLDLESFGLLRQGEFWEAMLVWIEDRQADRRQEAEVIRGVGLRLFNLWADGPALKGHEFIPFPWDPEEKPDDGALSKMDEAAKKASLENLLKHVNWL